MERRTFFVLIARFCNEDFYDINKMKFKYNRNVIIVILNKVEEFWDFYGLNNEFFFIDHFAQLSISNCQRYD